MSLLVNCLCWLLGLPPYNTSMPLYVSFYARGRGGLTEPGSKSTTMTKMTTCSPLAIIGRPPATLSPKSFPMPLDYNDEIVVIILHPSLCPTSSSFAAQRWRWLGVDLTPPLPPKPTTTTTRRPPLLQLTVVLVPHPSLTQKFCHLGQQLRRQ